MRSETLALTCVTALDQNGLLHVCHVTANVQQVGVGYSVHHDSLEPASCNDFAAQIETYGIVMEYMYIYIIYMYACVYVCICLPAVKMG